MTTVPHRYRTRGALLLLLAPLALYLNANITVTGTQLDSLAKKELSQAPLKIVL